MTDPNQLSGEAQPYAEHLQRLAVFMEPEALGFMTSELKGMYHNEVPGVSFELRKTEVVKGPVIGGKWTLEYGKTRTSVGDSTVTFSDLLEVEWTAPQPSGNFVTINASADVTGNNHPKLVVTEHPKANREEGGRICLITESQVSDWLAQFVYDLAVVDGEIYKFWVAPRHPKSDVAEEGNHDN